jgi:Na+-transporting NADH:ubiquinone oxidoreductase subunit A
MPEVIKLRKGLDIKLKGTAEKELVAVKAAQAYALVPDDFVGVTPKVIVAEGQHVKAGEALFVDKKRPEVKFVSPVSGTVAAVNRGARRKVMSIVVTPDAKQEYAEFGVKSVHSLNGEQVKQALLDSGMFAFLRQRPYDVVANPNSRPKAIFVSAFDSKPLAPDFEYVIKGNEADFQAGLSALAKMAPTYLGVSGKQTHLNIVDAKNVEINVFKGKHPAGNVGVQINHINPINKGEIVWTVGAEETIFIGRLFNKGIVDLTRTIAVAGSQVENPAYCKVVLGAQISSIVEGRIKGGCVNRIINGNVLTGPATTEEGYLGAFANMVTVIPDGSDKHEILGWAMPRFKEFSVSRAYFSFLFPNKEYVLDARLKGEERHMINSNEYDKVFPMDIYPEYLIKAIIAGDIEKMEAAGIYEVAPEDFALCEFVDSSKLELQRIVREGLMKLRSEME